MELQGKIESHCQYACEGLLRILLRLLSFLAVISLTPPSR